MARGVDRRQIFVDDEDYRAFTRLLAMVTREKEWRLMSFCQMPNHVHLLIETPKPNLGRGMQFLLGEYAPAFNERQGRDGHLFQGRFKSIRVKTDDALIRLVGYITANPVKARLCKRARDWPWGSDALVNSPGSAPPWLAHKRLVDRLEDIVGSRCYAQIVATWERPEMVRY